MRKMCFLTVESVVYKKNVPLFGKKGCVIHVKKMKIKQNTERYEIQRKRRKKVKKCGMLKSGCMCGCHSVAKLH